MSKRLWDFQLLKKFFFVFVQYSEYVKRSRTSHKNGERLTIFKHHIHTDFSLLSHSLFFISILIYHEYLRVKN